MVMLQKQDIKNRQSKRKVVYIRYLNSKPEVRIAKILDEDSIKKF